MYFHFMTLEFHREWSEREREIERERERERERETRVDLVRNLRPR